MANIDVGRLKRYIRENWGAPFVVAFILLIAICAGLMICGRQPLADDIAAYAYYALVVGVALQFVFFLKKSERNIE